MASIQVEQRCLTLPIGTKISITIRGRALPMLLMGLDLAAALFSEDDVPFSIEVDNTRSRKGITFEVTINNDTHWYSLGPGVKGEPMQALVANGRKLHFKSQATDDGRLLVAATANKYAMGYDDAAVMCSKIKFNVKVEKEVERVNPIPMRIHQETYGFHEPMYFSTSTSVRVSHRDFIDSSPSNGDFREERSAHVHEDVDCNFETEARRYGATPVPRAEAGERGVICYGERSTQAYGTTSPAKIDEMYVIKPFVIELRMESRYAPI